MLSDELAIYFIKSRCRHIVGSFFLLSFQLMLMYLRGGSNAEMDVTSCFELRTDRAQPPPRGQNSTVTTSTPRSTQEFNALPCEEAHVSRREMKRQLSDVKSLQRQRSGLQDDGQNKAAIAYIKRTLCARPQSQDTSTSEAAIDITPLEDLLPPLTSSNDIDVELYALIAVIMSNFVQVWYNRITPDQEFVAEIVQIIAHCTRGLEQRLRQVDLESVLLDELPDLLLEHIETARVSRASRTGNISQRDQWARYLALRPHKALEPVPDGVEASHEQQENEVAWCLLLVDRVLPLVLPPEDLLNPCLHVLVSEIFSEMVFHNGLCVKACEPWLLWDGIAKALQSMRTEGHRALMPQDSATNRLEEFGLLSTASAPKAAARPGSLRGRFEVATQLFWLTVQCVMTLWVLLRSLTTTLMQARSIPPRVSRLPHRSKKLGTPNEKPESAETILDSGPETRPIFSMTVWCLISRLLLLDRRMPWLTGMLSLLQWAGLNGPGQLCRTNSTLDR